MRRVTDGATDMTFATSCTAARRPVAAPASGRLVTLPLLGAAVVDDDAPPANGVAKKHDEVLCGLPMRWTQGNEVQGYVAVVDEGYIGDVLMVIASAKWRGKLAVWAVSGGDGRSRAVNFS